MLTALFASRKLLALAAIAIIVAGSVAYVAHLRAKVSTAYAQRDAAVVRAANALDALAAMQREAVRMAARAAAAEAAAASEADAAAAERARYLAAARRAAGAPVAEDGPLAGVLRDGLGRLRELAAERDPDGDPHAAPDGPADAAAVRPGADGP